MTIQAGTILHIGMPKTATTAIQRNILDKFPDISNIGNPINVNDHDKKTIRYFLIHSSDEEFESFYDYIKNIINKMYRSNTCLALSLEGVSIGNLGPVPEERQNRLTIAYRLNSLFPEAEVLITTRDQVRFLKSFYLQAYKAGNISMPFKKWIEQSYNNAGVCSAMDICDYKELVDIYASVFGYNAVNIMPYESYAENPEILIKWLAERTGGTKEEYLNEWHKGGWQNPRATNLEARLKRVVNSSAAIQYLLKYGPSSKAKQIVRKISRHIDIEYTEEIKDMLVSYYYDKNRNVENRFNLDLQKWGYP